MLEVALLAPDALGMHLVDLGADVIKVEPPAPGDYVRQIGAVMVEGSSLLHRRWNRGKRSVVIDMRTAEGAKVFLELAARSEAVIEGLRPGALSKRGLGYEKLREVNPAIVLVSLSGFGQTGPYRDLASHGVAYDSYAGLAPPTAGPEGHPSIPNHVQVGILAGPLYGATALLAGVMRARITGQGCWIDVSEADSAVAWKVAELERDEMEGRAGSKTPTGSALADSVRYQYYRTADDRFVLLMASERKFWVRFCEAIDRPDLAERYPGIDVGDHAAGNLDLRGELAGIFRQRTQEAWVQLFLDANVPGSPVHTGTDVRDDPHFRARSRWLDRSTHRTPLLATPVRTGDDHLDIRPAPKLGEHTAEVLEEVLGYQEEGLRALEAVGAIKLHGRGASSGEGG